MCILGARARSLQTNIIHALIVNFSGLVLCIERAREFGTAYFVSKSLHKSLIGKSV